EVVELSTGTLLHAGPGRSLGRPSRYSAYPSTKQLPDCRQPRLKRAGFAEAASVVKMGLRQRRRRTGFGLRFDSEWCRWFWTTVAAGRIPGAVTRCASACAASAIS